MSWCAVVDWEAPIDEKLCLIDVAAQRVRFNAHFSAASSSEAGAGWGGG